MLNENLNEAQKTKTITKCINTCRYIKEKDLMTCNECPYYEDYYCKDELIEDVIRKLDKLFDIENEDSDYEDI